MQDLELAVPGTYMIGEPVVTIAAFALQLTVITSKQRPWKLRIHGSVEYMFFLNGHEDFHRVRSHGTLSPAPTQQSYTTGYDLLYYTLNASALS